jgi:hypothetical protein
MVLIAVRRSGSAGETVVTTVICTSVLFRSTVDTCRSTGGRPTTKGELRDRNDG